MVDACEIVEGEVEPIYRHCHLLVDLLEIEIAEVPEVIVTRIHSRHPQRRQLYLLQPPQLLVAQIQQRLLLSLFILRLLYSNQRSDLLLAQHLEIY